ncbi:hypothetical protein Hanom_Chr12g01147701 [Helianthus anomalus]
MWGEQPPYGEFVMIVDGNNLWVVRLKRTGLGPLLGDGFTKVVRDSGTNFKGGATSLYVGDRLSDSCVSTHGWSELVNNLVLDKRSTFIFTMAGCKTFELSVFNHQTGTEIHIKKVELAVLDDSINGDDGYDLMIAKPRTDEADVDEGGVGDGENEYMQLSTFESIVNFNDDLNKKIDTFTEFPSSACQSNVDHKGKAKVVGDERLPSRAKPKRKAYISITPTTDVVGHKRSTVKRLYQCILRVHQNVICPSIDNLRDVTIQNLRTELINMSTRAEKSVDGYMNGFTKWLGFLKSNHIQFGPALFFKYVKSSQLLMLTKVVHKTTKKRGRA